MLSFGHPANETFSLDPEGTEGLYWAGTAKPEESDNIDAVAWRRGDEVVFDRLDLAEALGIWRNARGRIVGVHRWDGPSATVDVQFEGHEILERYLPDLFRRVH